MNRLLTAALLFLPACAVSMGPPTTKAEALPVAMYDAEGRRLGTATLTADSAGLTIVLDVAGLAAGEYPVGIHEHGLCERPDFLSAGAQLHDLRSIIIGADGRGRATLRYAPVTGRFVPKVIFGGDGTALLILGGSGGSRLACGIMI